MNKCDSNYNIAREYICPKVGGRKGKKTKKRRTVSQLGGNCYYAGRPAAVNQACSPWDNPTEAQTAWSRRYGQKGGKLCGMGDGYLDSVVLKGQQGFGYGDCESVSGMQRGGDGYSVMPGRPVGGMTGIMRYTDTCRPVFPGSLLPEQCGGDGNENNNNNGNGYNNNNGNGYNMNKPKVNGNVNTNKPKVNGNVNTNKPKVNGNVNTNKPKVNGNANTNKPKANGNANTNKPNGNINTNKPKANGNVNTNKPKANGNANTNKPKVNGNANTDKPNGNGNNKGKKCCPCPTNSNSNSSTGDPGIIERLKGVFGVKTQTGGLISSLIQKDCNNCKIKITKNMKGGMALRGAVTTLGNLIAPMGKNSLISLVVILFINHLVSAKKVTKKQMGGSLGEYLKIFVPMGKNDLVSLASILLIHYFVKNKKKRIQKGGALLTDVSKLLAPLGVDQFGTAIVLLILNEAVKHKSKNTKKKQKGGDIVHPLVNLVAPLGVNAFVTTGVLVALDRIFRLKRDRLAGKAKKGGSMASLVKELSAKLSKFD